MAHSIYCLSHFLLKKVWPLKKNDYLCRMKKNRNIKILIGVPASGKSTWVKKFLLKNPNYISVNRDYFRLMFRNENMCEHKIEDLITNIFIKTVHAALVKKLNVIIDNTNLKEKYIQQFIDEFKYSADIEYQVFDISLDKAIERDNNRTSKVGDAVIKRMYKDYKILMDSFHFQPVKKIEYRPLIKPIINDDIPDAVIFDIDGTVAHRKNRGNFDWDKVDRDEVIKIVAAQVAYHKSMGRKIIFFTGREDVCREKTEKWLILGNMEFDELHMRKENDHRKDTIVKKEMYENHIKGKYNVLAVYDDRLQVLDMWYKEGIFTFNVNQGQIPY